MRRGTPSQISQKSEQNENKGEMIADPKEEFDAGANVNNNASDIKENGGDDGEVSTR